MRRSSRHPSLSATFCSCIKDVRKKVTPRTPFTAKTKKKEKEKAAIAICVRSVLQRRGKTLKQFRCKQEPYLRTQALKHS
jgi:hypothetical protein